ncbi:MAG: DUF2851 family protein, partial [Ignavibacteriales bacterium]|nr:DUF2851 family protein [Ignavibacteriales bacterium]
RLWKQHKTEFHNEVMNGSVWQFFRLRPDNFPTIRIAGAAKLIQRFIQDSVLKTIVQILKATDLKSQDKYSSIIQLFIVPIDGFWSTHYRFGERSQTIRTKLIGKSRADEIVLNAVIPIALLYARIFKDKDIRQEILSLYEHCPLSSENTITRTISHQFLKEKMQLDTVLLQQGAIQLYKFYCTEERCGDCEVGKAIHR